MAKKEKRLQALLSYINACEYVPITQLMEEFKVSKSTIIRDLTQLDEDGQIERIHGGARAITSDRLTQFHIREEMNKDAKRLIAKEAATQIQDHDIVYLDTGSTCFMLFEEITAQNVTIFTPNLAIVNAETKSNISHIYVLEGEVSKTSYSLGGNLTLENMKRICPNKIFFSALGLNHRQNHEIRCATELQMSSYKLLCKMDGMKILLLDSSKIGIREAFQGNSIRDVDLMITDDQIKPEDAESIRNDVPQLIIAKYGDEKKGQSI